MLRFTNHWYQAYVVLHLFQNILCYGLTSSDNYLCKSYMSISRHPMLRFTQRLLQTYIVLNFKTFYVTVCQSCEASLSVIIHFKTFYVTVYQTETVSNKTEALFQNILCYGLPNNYFDRFCQNLYFKTSYVTVYYQRTHTRYQFFRISKHPVLRFTLQ